MKNIKLTTILCLACGIMATSTQANFLDLFRKDKEEENNPIQNIFQNLFPNYQKPEEQHNFLGGDNSFENIWDILCDNIGDGPQITNQEDHFENLISNFREICGTSVEVENFCTDIREKFQDLPKIDLQFCRPPSNEVPEPSTYGVIGASALLGLILIRRFKTRRIL